MKTRLYLGLLPLFLFAVAACAPATTDDQVSDTLTEQVGSNIPDDNESTVGEANDPEVNGEEGNNVTDTNDNPQDQGDDGITINAIQLLAPAVGSELGAVSLSGSAGEYNKAANSFALKLLPFLYEGQSFVASPISIQMALSMAAEGAVGLTLSEMLDVLGFPGLDGLGAYSKSLIEQLPAVDLSIKLQLADAMIARDDVGILTSYKDAMEHNFYAPTVTMPFSNPAKVRAAVNDWCSRNTDGLIPSILDDEKTPDPNSLAFILNALYFKADWTSPFDSEYQVVKGVPFRVGGNEVPADYMCSDEYLLYSDMGDYRVAFRSLGAKAKFDIAVLLPKEDDGLEGLLKELPSLDVNKLRSTAQYTELYYRLPAFEASSSYDLVEQLKVMGIQRAFTSNAEFDNMFEEVSCYISSVRHKAKVDINTGGIEGAAVTCVEMEEKSVAPGEDAPKPVEFYADHPFVYIISEQSSGAILFEGVFKG